MARPRPVRGPAPYPSEDQPPTILHALNGQQQYYFDDVRSGVFHDYQAIWEPGKITLIIDGHAIAVVTEHVPVDYNHGGMNEVFAFLNINDATSLVVRDVSYVPLDGVGALNDGDVVYAGMPPPSAPGDSGDEQSSPPAADATDWNALAAQAEANFAATEQWFV